ncbi:MAG TPA: bacillithiol biosynthesis cysteine-adding enzyme BshC [Pyrinomonadaceae bacterium]|nr:bacillithiol biosynthesis cysteine-adding enzyme BshC [Pyrinomonadaceae bacterium]
MKQESARESLHGKTQFRISELPFAQIPAQSRLFLEFQTAPLSLKRFYPNAVATPSDIAKFVPEVLANYQTDRTGLCDALAEINNKAGAGEKTLANIELLRQSSTVAVLTGQQAGLFTGPLYTIYKALSAIKLADELRLQGTAAVPVFWAATEDHDIEEVSKAYSLANDGGLFESKYVADESFIGLPVGEVKLDDSVAGLIDEMLSEMSNTPFSAGLKATLADSWKEGTGFGDAFISSLAAVFAELGLIFIDPIHPGIKRLASPIYVSAIERADEMVSAIRERGRVLDTEGYHTQVLVDEDYFPLFWHDEEGKRRSLRKTGEGVYRTKETRVELARDGLIELANNQPERLSPGVMLRPVVQDYLLPTVCYFGGAAEIAYFAQNSEAYRVLKRPVTPILHRQSFTIVEHKHRRALDKFGLELSDLFAGIEQISLKLAERDPADTGQLFTDVEQKIEAELDRIESQVESIDATVAANFAKRRRKMIYHIGATRKKALLAQMRNDEVASRQIAGLFASFLPNGGLQERSLNVFTYLNKFGPNFIDWLYAAIDLEDKDHRIVDL